MGIHGELGIPAKLISYSVLEQIPPSANPEEFRSSQRASLGKIRNESALLREAFQASLLETRMKFAQVAKGSLNQFLSTPIKSDNEDVQRIIKDAFEKYSEQIMPTSSVGIETAWSSQVIVDSMLVGGQTKISGIIRKMLSAGKRKLKESGFKLGRNPSNIFESVYLYDGGWNLDALEYLLGKSITDDVRASAIDCSRSSLYTVVSSVGDSEQKISLWEASIIPARIDTPGTEFAAEIGKTFETLMKEFNLHHLSLWKKKLSSGEGDAFVVRARMIPDHKLLFEVVKWLTGSGNESLRKGLTENGALVVKEIIA
jgi:hypothetical protein